MGVPHLNDDTEIYVQLCTNKSNFKMIKTSHLWTYVEVLRI